jgi:uncharacterized protein (TIGR02996 family)
MRTFQYSDAKSHKFWTIDVQANAFTVTYGKVGAAGQTQTKSFATPEKTQAEADKLIREKLGKGYVETTPKANVSEAEALEAAIRANPDDRTVHAAYADYLTERGDPRGEFIQVQLALEDESLPAAERKQLQTREKELLKAHAKNWLGAWAGHEDARHPGYDWQAPQAWDPYKFTRGLPTCVEVGDLTVNLAREIVKAPTLGFVRELIVHGIDYEEGDYEEGLDTEGADEHPSQYVLLRWPQLRHIRVFRFGGADPVDDYDDWCPYSCHTPGDHVSDFVKQMPDIEELHVMAHFREDLDKLAALPMPRLRTLLLYHGWNYPLEKLSKNPSLTNLRELYCHPHALEGGDEPYIQLAGLRAVCRSKVLTNLTHLQLRLADFGDAGIEEIIKSGILKRLKVLDLRHGIITADGAIALADCPDVKNLDRLDLSWNRIGAAGTTALRETGVSVNVEHQQIANQEDWETFGHGDIE